MGDLFAVAVIQADLVPEGHARTVCLVRPVDRPEDAIGAHREQGANESRLVPIAAGGDVKMIADVFERRLLEAALFREGNHPTPDARVGRILYDEVTAIQIDVVTEKERRGRRIDRQHRELLRVRTGGQRK